MKLVYILNQRFPTEKAYGIQVAQMCRAFSLQGLEVELVVPTRMSKESSDPFSYYGIDASFKFTRIFSLDWYLPGALNRLAFWIKNLVSAFRLAQVARSHKADIVYAREELPLWFLSYDGRSKFVLEVHRFSQSRASWYRLLSRRGVRFVAVTEGLRQDLIGASIPAHDILTAHDAVDVQVFKVKIDQAETRRQLGLPADKKIVLYAGHLYERKGADVLAESASQLPDGTVVVFVGGTEEELKLFKKKWGSMRNIIIAGRKPHTEISLWLHSADVLVLPSLPDNTGQEKYTSPLKLFEYMASNRPMVVSDLPALREVLSRDEVIFVPPGSASSLAEGIKSILSDAIRVRAQINKVRENIEKYSWSNRVRNILLFLKS